MNIPEIAVALPPLPDSQYVVGVLGLHAIAPDAAAAAVEAGDSLDNRVPARTLCGDRAFIAREWAPYNYRNPHLQNRDPAELCVECAWRYALDTHTTTELLTAIGPRPDEWKPLTRLLGDPAPAVRVCRQLLADLDLDDPELIQLLMHATRHTPMLLVAEDCSEGTCEHPDGGCYESGTVRLPHLFSPGRRVGGGMGRPVFDPVHRRRALLGPHPTPHLHRLARTSGGPVMRKQSRTAPGHAIAALVGASVLATLSACGTSTGSTGPQYLGVCVDPATNVRVDDSYCTPGGLDQMDWIDTTAYPTISFVSIGQREVFPRTIIVVHAPPAGRSSSLSVPRTGGTASSVRTNIAKTSTSTKTGTGTSSKTGSGSSSVTRGGLGVKGSTGGGSTPHISAGS